MFNKYLKRHFKTYLKVSILVLICFFVFAKTSNHSNIIPSNKGEEAIYSEILDSYYYNIQNEWKDYSFEGYTDRKSNDYKCYLFPSYMSGSEYGELIGYSFIDLNDDGVSELLIGLKKFPNEPQEYYTPIIYDMYTYCAGSVYHIASSGERYRYELCEDYSIYYSGSGGAGIWSNTRCIYREGKELSIIEDIYSDRINDDLSTQLYYYHEDNPEVFHLIGEDRHNINYEFIDYEQAEIIRKTWPKTVNFKLNLFSNYSPQNPKPKSYRYNE